MKIEFDNNDINKSGEIKLFVKLGEALQSMVMEYIDSQNAKNLRIIRELPFSVKSLDLSGCDKLGRLDLKGCINLDKINITLCESLRCVENISHSVSLKSIIAVSSGLKQLAVPSSVTSLNLCGCKGLETLDLSLCKNLKNIDLTDCDVLQETVELKENLKALIKKGYKIEGLPKHFSLELNARCGTPLDKKLKEADEVAQAFASDSKRQKTEDDDENAVSSLLASASISKSSPSDLQKQKEY